MKILTLIISGLLLCPLCLATEDFTLYFVRHAEKVGNDNDPDLSLCGYKRAKQLVRLLSTANIKSIYSTNYRRTIATASPLSAKTHVAIQSYSPKHLKQLSLNLIQRKENSLVVGHSNTTPELVQLLSNNKIDNITEDNYRMMYQVRFVNNKAFLTTHIQPLLCD